MYIDILDWIGFNGPFILIFLSIFIMLYKKSYVSYCFLYIIGIIINSNINSSLKLLLKHPRPKENKELYYLGLHPNKDTPVDVFGMPSAHAQSVTFSLIYIYLVTKDLSIFLFYLLICICTLYQRFNTYMHTILQLICGSIAGLGLGYITYIVSKYIIEYKFK